MAPPQIRSSGPRCLGDGSLPWPAVPYESISRLSRRYPARKMTKQTLASSPGWKTSGPPRSIQSVAPLIVLPITGIAGRTSRTMAEMPRMYLTLSSSR